MDNHKNYSSIAIIPARGGSKGLKKKNLKVLDGKPLIGRVIQHALEANCIDTILVTTDDIEIADVARRYGAEVPFIRPEKHSGDLSTTEDTLKHALLKYEKMFKKYFDIAVFLTATDIFRKAKWIAQAVKKLKDSPKLDSVFVGYNTHKNFWEKQVDGSWKRIRPWMSEYSSRQVRRAIVREDTGLACASRASLWREGKRIGDNVEILVNDDDFTGIDVHHQEDLDLAEAALKIRKKRRLKI
jgi:CMP-N,N'-diacetyllegionaminic acid synthase